MYFNNVQTDSNPKPTMCENHKHNHAARHIYNSTAHALPLFSVRVLSYTSQQRSQGTGDALSRTVESLYTPMFYYTLLSTLLK